MSLPSRPAPWIVAALIGFGGPACSGQDTRFQQHQEKLESLGASMSAIADAWLAGSVTGTYAVTAFEQTLLLVEQERHTFATRPDALADARGARLSADAEQLSRLLAATIHDVEAADAESVRAHLLDIPVTFSRQDE